MNHTKPSGSPNCWGLKYQDGEDECMQCPYKDSCRQEMLFRVANPGLPVIRNYAPPSPPPPPRLSLPAPAATIVPLPPRPYFVPTLAQSTTPVKSPTPTIQTQQPQTPQYYQSSTGFALPNPSNPSPMASWHRPGAPSPGYYFTQYPGEGVGTRLAKNAVLRALEAIFGEFMQFFRHWTWPPRS